MDTKVFVTLLACLLALWIIWWHLRSKREALAVTTERLVRILEGLEGRGAEFRATCTITQNTATLEVYWPGAEAAEESRVEPRAAEPTAPWPDLDPEGRAAMAAEIYAEGSRIVAKEFPVGGFPGEKTDICMGDVPIAEVAPPEVIPLCDECETCRGEGKVRMESQLGVPSSGGEIECPDCDGSGAVRCGRGRGGC